MSTSNDHNGFNLDVDELGELSPSQFDLFGDDLDLNLGSPNATVNPTFLSKGEPEITLPSPPRPSLDHGVEQLAEEAQLYPEPLSFDQTTASIPPTGGELIQDPIIGLDLSLDICLDDFQQHLNPNLTATPMSFDMDGGDDWMLGLHHQHPPELYDPSQLDSSRPNLAQPSAFNPIQNDTTLDYQASSSQEVPYATEPYIPSLGVNRGVAPSMGHPDFPIPTTEVNYYAEEHYPQPPLHKPSIMPGSSISSRGYRPPEQIKPSQVPSGNPIPHKRGGKNTPAEDFYPMWRFFDWGFTGRDANTPTFRYHKSGEWNNQLTFSKEELEFYFNQTASHLTMWIQHQPAQYTHRFAQGSYSMKCRFKDCLAKNRTILKGFWRVAFDERAQYDEPLESGTRYDPFLNAGYVHLYCLEKHFDLLDLHNRFIVKPDNRNLRFEERNPMKVARDYIELADVFTNWHCGRDNNRRKYGHDHPVSKRHKLWFQLTAALIQQEGGARKRTRQERGGVSLDKHMGDLKKYERLVDNRLQKQKNIRAQEKAEAAEEAARVASQRALGRRGSSPSGSSWHQSPTPEGQANVPQAAPQDMVGIKRSWHQDGFQPPAKRSRGVNPEVTYVQGPPVQQLNSAASQPQRINKRGPELSGHPYPLEPQNKNLKVTPGSYLPVDSDTLERYNLDYKRRYQLRFASAPPARPPKRGSLRRE
ncbi:uncharacterized protein MKZ38_003730 [Zalerion maritima]|uniref:Uncharacterized protein n=1 Tax=Zalerion maritima TaxID=339359 RepID=A0AAD5RYS7_9PEZI|nr:uncharacterized protein MKZ38_003730 [Zalerion maritima]